MDNNLKLLWFTADWCGPCRSMKPQVEQWKNLENINLEILNVDKAPEPAQKYGITSIPCFVYVKNEKEVDRVVGARPVNILKEKYKQHQ